MEWSSIVRRVSSVQNLSENSSLDSGDIMIMDMYGLHDRHRAANLAKPRIMGRSPLRWAPEWTIVQRPTNTLAVDAKDAASVASHNSGRILATISSTG